MPQDPGAEFHNAFDPILQRRLVSALQRAYENACERHDSAVGSNEQTFGFCLYFFARHELGVAASESGGQIRVISTMPTFRLQVGYYEVACHRVGRTIGENIWTSFPKNDGAAATMAMDQYVPQYLPGLEPDLQLAKKVVLAHLGNPEDGYAKSFLCIPTREQDGRIVEWGYAEELGAIEPLPSAAPPPPEKYPEETITDPVLRRKGKSTDDRK